MKSNSFVSYCCLLLAFVCSGCYRSFTISGKLDNKRWYGMGQGNVVNEEKIKNCSLPRFGFGATTDIPFDLTRTSKPTGCPQNCHAKQHLDFFIIPLAEGKYDLGNPDPCLPSLDTKARLAHFQTNPDGAHILKGESVSVVDDFRAVGKSWIHITKYDSETGALKGKFELHLVNKQGKQLHFKKGRFKFKL
ncbi:hypothetical protein [Runella sp. SP2]|uniref:hypothetical protein n=1 Tax=Runella sp. SP2 TaxID=2268026 RepID=UPI000F081436|nr:hypothetical protein [Runella sp. SP2]AYQ33248.1 hypothetical protein DTQ70_14245 [Runella sp. SP2]